MKPATHAIFGVFFVGGLVVAAIAEGWTGVIAGLGTSAVTMFIWAFLVDRERREWDDSGISWRPQVPWRQSKLLKRSEHEADV